MAPISHLMLRLVSKKPCSFENFTTLAHTCVAPGLLAPAITYTIPEGTTNGATITAWYLDYVFYHPVP